MSYHHFILPPQEGKDESGNAVWKHRLKSWNDKKNQKKKDQNNTMTESETPLEQQVEEKQ